MENNLSYTYRCFSKDWIASYKLDDGYILNFCCGSMQDQDENRQSLIPDSVVSVANRILPEAKKFWSEYLQDMLFIFSIDEDCIKNGNYDQNICSLNYSTDFTKIDILNAFAKENILLRKWHDGDGSKSGLSEALLVDALGRVWEFCGGDIDGWHKVSELFPGEVWPLTRIPIASCRIDFK
jgi:hypothetical protein